MKKLLLLLFILSFYLFSNAAYVPPIRTMQIPVAQSHITIDGVVDEPGWSAEQSTDAFNLTSSTCADDDFTFTFRVCYDFDYLYVFGKILDDYENDWEWGESDQWTFDCVEIYLDLDTTGSGNNPTYDTNTYQLRINRGIDSISNDYGRGCKRSDHKFYWENTADGWVFEAALNWKFVLGNGQKLDDFNLYTCGASGFDVSGVDSDSDGPNNRKCQTAWDRDLPDDENDRTEDNAWNNRTVFGVINFVYDCVNVDTNVTINIKFFPNPVSDYITFENLINDNILSVTNILGQVIFTENIMDNKVNLSRLTSGIYLGRISNDVFKFIKE